MTLSSGTAYYGLATDRALCEMAVRAVAAGHVRRATARSVQGAKETVCAWLDHVARHCRGVMLALWPNLHVTAGQRDEGWGCVPIQEVPRPGAKLSGATAGDAGVWLAFAPGWRRVVAGVSGPRAPASADGLRARGAHVPEAHRPCLPVLRCPPTSPPG